VTSESFEKDNHVRQPIYWGIFEYGNMMASLYFYYGAFNTLPIADSLRLFVRENVNEPWEDISSDANHNIEEEYFELAGENIFAEYALGWNKNSVTDIGEGTIVPDDKVLLQNYPNPFNPITTINFTLPSAGKMNISIYDIRGRLVRNLVDNHSYTAGTHTLTWNGIDNHKQKLSSGIYFCRLHSSNVSVFRKLTLLK